MNLEGRICRLRAVEPHDVDTMYAWENDTRIWRVSGTTAPYSRQLLERFVEQQRFDIWQTRQMRLMIEPFSIESTVIGPKMENSSPIVPEVRSSSKVSAGNDSTGGNLTSTESTRERVGCTDTIPIGALDLFEFDPQHSRAGIGILIHDPHMRGRGFATDALDVVCRYAYNTLGLHQLWCNIAADNPASIALFRSAGFTEAGVKREWIWTSEGFCDEIMMQKIFPDGYSRDSNLHF